MRLVEDEDVDVVRIGVAELVEVAELRLAGAAPTTRRMFSVKALLPVACMAL